MAHSLFTATAIANLFSHPKARVCLPSKQLSFSSPSSFKFLARKITKHRKIPAAGVACRCSADMNGVYSQSQKEERKTTTVFPGGLKREEVKLPGLALRVTAKEVNEGALKVIDSAVSNGFATIVVLEGAGDGVGGGQLYEAACALKSLVRGRAHLLVAERVDIAAAAGAAGVVLSDEGLPAIIARDMMQSAGLESTILPLVARTVSVAKSAQCITATEGADLLMLVIENPEDADILLESVCQHIGLPVFAILDLPKVSPVASLTSKLAKAGASGLVISVADATYFGDDILKEVKTLLFSTYLTDSNIKANGVEDLTWKKIGNNNVSSDLTEPGKNVNSLDLKVKKILDEERPLLLEVINLVREAAPRMEEISLLVDAVAQLEKLFLLVIVGEFNSGKSTMINAMLGKRYLKEGVVPTTNEITVLCYSGEGHDEEERFERHPDGHLIRYLPAPLLKQTSLVDTPGTNVIVQRQQRLTEEFVPRADLVLFVVSADRPLTESEVTFLRYIRQWGKKVIFILNKSDIFKDVKELEEAMRFVKENAQQLLSLDEITLYPVSSRSALEAKVAATTEDRVVNLEILSKDPDWITSGFSVLEDFIFNFLDGSTDSGAERVRLKLETPIGISTTLLAVTQKQILEESVRASTDLMSIKENISKLKQYQQSMENDSFSWRKQALSMIEAATKRAEKKIDSILKVSNVEVAAEYILRGDRSGSMPIITSFQSEVIDNTVLDIQKLLGEYWTWLRSNNAQQEVLFRGSFENQYHSLSRSDEFDTGEYKSLEKQIQARSIKVLEEFNVKAAAIVFEQEIREVVIETFGGLGVAGLSASVLTSVLPTTVEDLIALALCSAGGLYGVWKLPQRRIEVKGKVQQVADSFAKQLESAMQEDLVQAMRDVQSQVEFITKPYHDTAQSKANSLGDFLAEIKELEQKLQLLQFKILNLRAS